MVFFTLPTAVIMPPAKGLCHASWVMTTLHRSSMYEYLARRFSNPFVLLLVLVSDLVLSPTHLVSGLLSDRVHLFLVPFCE